MKRTILNPHWINNARTIISAQFQYDDGRLVEATISEDDRSNPDLAEIKANFSDAELEENTQKNIAKVTSEAQKKRVAEETARNRKLNEDLFAVKLKVFEIDTIKNSANKKMKSQIRKAKNELEVTAWAAALLMTEMNMQSAVEDTTGE